MCEVRPGGAGTAPWCWVRAALGLVQRWAGQASESLWPGSEMQALGCMGVIWFRAHRGSLPMVFEAKSL